MKEEDEIGEECLKQENASQADMDELTEKKNPTRREGKCLIACYYEAYEMKEKDGKITEEGILKSLRGFKEQDEDIYKNLVKIMVEICLPEVKSTDRCEAAAEFEACYLSHTEKVNAIF